METNQNPTWINASPTKEFFIFMLTRDVPLTRAILDLVDNSVDGARREHPDNDFSGLKVSLEIASDHFRISDNCGGISVETARDYAFRFGRPQSASLTPHSIGQFGVGMKRSIFKLGRKFIVESATSDSRFHVEEDIEKWIGETAEKQGADWHFRFAQLEESIQVAPQDVGTRIEIKDLHASIAESFTDANFINRLADEISVAHAMNLDYGLQITLNGKILPHEPQRLLQSDDLQPSFVEHSYERQLIDKQDGAPVQVRLYAGVSERKLHEGGWYVFCNGRLVLRADQGSNTVWGRLHNVQQYHPNFAYFRGYAYFDSEDASLLPWTTTKTGVDTDSRVYKLAQQKMVETTKPILQFLSQLEKERVAHDAGDLTETPLEDAIQSASAVRVLSIQSPVEWSAPQPIALPPGLRMQKIQYIKPANEVEEAMRLLKVSNFTEVGQKTFDYFMQYEGDE